MDKNWLQEFYKREIGGEARIFQSPGRINLIGEHTDYNGGFVMPAGIDKACYLAIGEAQNDCTLIAYDLNEKISFNDCPTNLSSNHWINYLMGVRWAFEKRGVIIPHVNMLIRSDIPIGAGLSSSAALESVVAHAFNTMYGAGFSKLELAKIAQEAENEYVGLKCGIMDMFASIHSQKNHAIQLDCRSLAYEYVPLQMEGISILLFDTCIKHELASSAYNTRREECESVVEHFQRKGVLASTLRDITFELLSSVKNEIDPICYQRAAFVLAENKRVSLFAEAMRQADWSLAGMQMAGSHAGLRDEYEVSCAELDHLVDITSQIDGVLGSRMMGGGFGGCTINLVKTEALNHVIEKTSSSYKNAFGVEPKYYIATTGDGACEL
jgi:galactokinase